MKTDSDEAVKRMQWDYNQESAEKTNGLSRYVFVDRK